MNQIPWLPKAAADTPIGSLRHFYTPTLGKMLQPAAETPADKRVEYLKAQHVQKHRVLTGELPTMWASVRDIVELTVRRGDLLVCEGGEVGRCAVVPTDMPGVIFQNSVHRIRSTRNSTRFLGYLLEIAAETGWFDIICNKATIAHLTVEKLGQLQIPTPLLQQQDLIVAFLDRKTAAIDALIAKKEQLLALLAEKRATVINEAVTKGLNRGVAMKDSGVPWVGEIPAHWQMRKLRYIAARLQGRIIVQPHLYFVDEGVPIVFGYNIKDGKIDDAGLSKVSHAADTAHSHARARAGDLYTVRLGTPGMTAVVPESLAGCHFASIMWIHQHVRADSDWLCHTMNSVVVQGQIDAANYGATMDQFNIADALNWVLPFPPKSEQKEIAKFLSIRLAVLAKTRPAIEQQLKSLREYRQAIITAAVTGQLDIAEAG